MYGNEQTDPLWNEATKRKNINLWLKKNLNVNHLSKWKIYLGLQ